MQIAFINHLEKKLNLKILDFMQLHGGCINQSFKISTKDDNYFVKINSDSNLFDTEEKGLITLSSTNTFFIPEVLTCNRYEDTYYLIIEFVESSHPKNDFWELFGQKLGDLHKNTKNTFKIDKNRLRTPSGRPKRPRERPKPPKATKMSRNETPLGLQNLLKS